MQSSKTVRSEEIKLLDVEVKKQAKQKGYIYSGIIELDKIKEKK